MSWLAGSVVLVLVTLCASSEEDKGHLEIHSQRTPITAASGSSLRLSCNAFYNVKICGLLHVAWREEEGAELTNPRKYFTTVNETLTDGNMRHRQVVTEFLDPRPEDSGRYQCNAECENKDTARGRAIQVTVRD
uniref:uncharacterized protein n=1 Tax=Semicossyphus pulcher TaxID=241346 RepID=UPI0037E7F2C7